MFPKKNGSQSEMNSLKLYADYKMKLEIALLFNIISWAAAAEI